MPGASRRTANYNGNTNGNNKCTTGADEGAAGSADLAVWREQLHVPRELELRAVRHRPLADRQVVTRGEQ